MTTSRIPEGSVSSPEHIENHQPGVTSSLTLAKAARSGGRVAKT